MNAALKPAIHGFTVIDHFVSDPDRVRISALAAGFGTWRPSKGEVGSSVYDGMNFWGDHATLLKGLSLAMRQPVYPNSMFFRVTNADTENAYVHSDREMGEYTAIVYLSKHDTPEHGTAFYRHRETGWLRMPAFSDLKERLFFERFKAEMVAGTAEHWEQLTLIPGIYNRAVIFEAPLFHARRPKNGFGSTPEDGRMVWVCHFGVA